MTTPRKKYKERDTEETKRKLLEAVSLIMREVGHADLKTMKISRLTGKSKGVISYHYKNLNELLKDYVKQKDYWPPFFERFHLSAEPGENELRRMFTELMQDNLNMFQQTPEMQKIILWQISQESPLLRSISDEREAEGAKLLNMTAPYFLHSDVNFKAIIALLLGGSYYLVLHAATNKSTVCGIDINWDKDRDEILKTIGQVIGWSWEKAKEKRAS